mmetsp:Transcript_32456/g.75416  ORF Transcript_32456/g.75416 Transcript_32456/m.75416 type:complete len:276 (+) Transcript_32456:230-1057(+)
MRGDFSHVALAVSQPQPDGMLAVPSILFLRLPISHARSAGLAVLLHSGLLSLLLLPGLLRCSLGLRFTDLYRLLRCVLQVELLCLAHMLSRHLSSLGCLLLPPPAQCHLPLLPLLRLHHLGCLSVHPPVRSLPLHLVGRRNLPPCLCLLTPGDVLLNLIQAWPQAAPAVPAVALQPQRSLGQAADGGVRDVGASGVPRREARLAAPAQALDAQDLAGPQTRGWTREDTAIALLGHATSTDPAPAQAPVDRLAAEFRRVLVCASVSVTGRGLQQHR